MVRGKASQAAPVIVHRDEEMPEQKKRRKPRLEEEVAPMRPPKKRAVAPASPEESAEEIVPEEAEASKVPERRKRREPRLEEEAASVSYSVRLREKKASVAPASPAEDASDELAEEMAPEAAEKTLVDVQRQDLDRSPLLEGEVQGVFVGDLLRIVRKLSSVSIGMQFFCRAKKGKEIPDDLVVKRFVQGQSRKALCVPVTKVPLFLATILSKKDFLAAAENSALELKMMMRLLGGLDKAEAEALVREAKFSVESPADLAVVDSFARLFGKRSAEVFFAKVPKADDPEKMVIVFGAISLVMMARKCTYKAAKQVVYNLMKDYFAVDESSNQARVAFPSRGHVSIKSDSRRSSTWLNFQAKLIILLPSDFARLKFFVALARLVLRSFARRRLLTLYWSLGLVVELVWRVSK
jgi:hypothetical protein